MSSSLSLKQQCCIWDQYKYAFYRKFREPKLYHYAAQGEWDLIPKRCKTHPKEANFVHSYPPKDTSLHRLVKTSSCRTCDDATKAQIYKFRQDAVQALLRTCSPAVCNTKDTFQRLPLHWACMDLPSNCSVSASDGSDGGCFHCDNQSIVLLLLERSPQSLREVDVEKRTPVHYLVARNNRISVQLLIAMVSKYPQVLIARDAVGETLEDIVKARVDEIENADEVLAVLQDPQLLASCSS